MLEFVFTPNTIAVVGEFDNPEQGGHTLVANLVEGGYGGKIIPISQDGKDVLGCASAPDIASAGRDLDLCVIASPPEQVETDVENAIRARVKGICIVTEGFHRELANTRDRIGKNCRDHGVRLLGPGSMGIINTNHLMNCSLIPKSPPSGVISFFSQSGALSTALVDRARSLGLGLSKIVSLGDKIDIDETDVLKFLGKDKHTRVVAGYMENIGEGSNFIKVAETVTASKPVIVLKAGTTGWGSKTALRRLGTSAGADFAYGAAFKRAGIVRAESLEELLDFSMAFSRQPLPKGPRIGIITNSGGAGIIATDTLENSGLSLAEISQTTEERLTHYLPNGAFVSNPVDLLAAAKPEHYRLAIEELASDSSVDALLIILTLRVVSEPELTADAVLSASQNLTKPIVVAFIGGDSVDPGRKILAQNNIPEYTSPKRAVGALRAMWEYASWRERPPRVVTRFPVNRRRIDRIITRHLRTGRRQIRDIDALEILKAYDFRTPEGELATNSEDAVTAAKRIGFPVSLKIVCSQIDEISPGAQVKKGLVTPAEIRDGFDLLILRMMRDHPEIKPDGVYVEHMQSDGTEVIMGMNRDPHFGPMLMFGLGGIFVEVMENTAFHLAPITAEEAKQMLLGTQSYEMLKGPGETNTFDINAIVTGLQKLSQLAMDFPQIDKVEINPLEVGEVEGESLVVNARMILKNGESR